MDIADLKFLKIKFKKHPKFNLEMEYLDKCNAVAALFLDANEEKCMLVKQFRPGADEEIYEIPAGLIDEEEDANEAIIREIREETGYEKENFDFLLLPQTPLFVSPGCSTEGLYIYIIKLKSNDIKPKPLMLDDTEDISTHWVKINYAFDLVKDMKSICALNIYKNMKN